jgi:hypothetical protein
MGWAQSTHSSQWAVGVTRNKCAANSGYRWLENCIPAATATPTVRIQPVTPPIRTRSPIA